MDTEFEITHFYPLFLQRGEFWKVVIAELYARLSAFSI